MTEEHSSGIKNWKQLLVVVLLAFLIPIVLITIVSQLVTGHMKATPDDDTQVLQRIKPVGEVVLAEASGPSGQRTGEQVFAQVCKNCHEAGLAGSPKFGDKAAWARVIAQGEKIAVDHAIHGIRAMPPKGGNPDLTDEEVHRGVVYMADAAGANWTAPAVAAPVATGKDRTGQQVVEAVCSRCHESGAGGAPRIGDQGAWRTRAARGFASVLQSALRGHAGMPARGGMAELSDNEIKNAIQYMMYAGTTPPAGATGTVGQSAAPAASSARAGAAPVPVASAKADGTKADGKKVFDTVCTACHTPGVAGAPKIGDKTAWSPRLKTGMDALYSSALHGKGAMPPKGGNTALPDADVKAAVDYMVSTAK